MIRKIIRIDEEKCNGCGVCAQACHEGAIGLVNGKAKLLRDDYCDGFGDCLPTCPTGAISFEEREAEPYNEEAVKEKNRQRSESRAAPHHAGCPGQAVHRFARGEDNRGNRENRSAESQLTAWPCQIRLVPVNAPFFDGANLLVAADCTAYAYAAMHDTFMRGKVTLIGCPKLDGVDYAEKLTRIITDNNIQSVTVVRMEVPCCGGLENAVKTALKNSGKFLPWQVVTVSVNGNILQ